MSGLETTPSTGTQKIIDTEGRVERFTQIRSDELQADEPKQQ